MKTAGPTGWRGVMNRGPQRSEFGLSPLADNVDSLTQRPRVRVSRIRHGIGGGMRLSDETEFSLSLTPRYNYDQRGRRLSLTPGRAAVGIYVSVLIGSLLIIHVNLRFKIHDMQMQQHALQMVQRHLEREASSVNSRTAVLGNLERLEEYAVIDREMVHTVEAPEVRIPRYTMEKYSPDAVAAVQKEQDEQVAAATHAKPKSPFRNLATMALAFAQSTR